MESISNDKLFDIMEDCLDRIHSAKTVSHKPNNDVSTHSPFFTSIQVKSNESYQIQIRNGGVIVKKIHPEINYDGKIEVRMGDYGHGGGMNSQNFALPLDLDKEASKRAILNKGNEAHWEAAKDYERRFHEALGERNPRDLYLFFSKELPMVFFEEEKNIVLDFNCIENLLKDVSKELLNGVLHSSDLEFYVYKEDRHLVNSEGSKIFTNFVRFQLQMELEGIDDNLLKVPHKTRFLGTDLSNIPNHSTLMDSGKKCLDELMEIISSPSVDTGNYPIILDGENHGTLWHEVAGHHLEAHRMQEDEYGSYAFIFKNKIDERVAPEFMSLIDDPTIKDLDGHYSFDEEGVKSNRVVLIENGVLKNYLHSRQSAGYFDVKSNGHSRSVISLNSVARMSNLFVESDNKASFDDLVEMLKDEICKQKKSHGYLFYGSNGGWTMTGESTENEEIIYYSTEPRHAFKIDKNGKSQRVKFASIVGLPTEVFNQIMITGDKSDLFNGYCGAESGIIPATHIAPPALIRNVTVKHKPKFEIRKVKEPIYHLK